MSLLATLSTGKMWTQFCAIYWYRLFTIEMWTNKWYEDIMIRKNRKELLTLFYKRIEQEDDIMK